VERPFRRSIRSHAYLEDRIYVIDVDQELRDRRVTRNAGLDRASKEVVLPVLAESVEAVDLAGG
jgi:hypothetical protein